MNDLTLPAAAWITTETARRRRQLDRLVQRLRDDRGIDEAVTKMIFLAIGVTLAIAAGVFIRSRFEQAQEIVPVPAAP
jgi:hypothetical protein